MANAAAQGRISGEQLDRISDLAGDDPAEDRRWVQEGPNWSPEDLAEELRRRRKPTVEDAAARRAARELRYWWNRDSGMLDGRFSLPDIDGATVERVFDEMIERMRPAKGQPWDTREHRGADALVELWRRYLDTDRDAPTAGARAHFVVHVPTRGPGCDRRIGLEVHHLWPASWGGTDQIANLATVCTTHHAELSPQGPVLLLGNPKHPAGLALVDRDDLPALAALAAQRARAGEAAA